MPDWDYGTSHSWLLNGSLLWFGWQDNCSESRPLSTSSNSNKKCMLEQNDFMDEWFCEAIKAVHRANRLYEETINSNSDSNDSCFYF
jgi:hypothetical protein